MTQTEEETPNDPSAHDWFESMISVRRFGRVCFLLLMMSIVGSAQQASSKITPLNGQELSKAKVIIDSKKDYELSGTSTEKTIILAAHSDSGAGTAEAALGSNSLDAEVNTSDAPASNEGTNSSLEEFSKRVTGRDQAQDERDEGFKFKPETFFQTRYSFWPANNSKSEAGSHFSVTRLEIGWAGRISRRFAAGIEIQFQSLIKGSRREMINDAFGEYYLTSNLSIKAGQFVKPFGFDAQQSSSVRESPERGMFVGYFFPGERDRGVMFSGNLNFLRSRALRGVAYSFAIFTGNVFFSDAKPQSNYVARARKKFEGGKLALGVSMQLGKQTLPGSLSGKRTKTILGTDFQYVKGRIGVRAELVGGNTPASLYTGDSVSSFRAIGHSVGGALFAVYRLSSNDDVYARYDQFNGDPTVGRSVRAFNFGYVRRLRKSSKFSFDYQLKNRRSFNDDAVNSRFTTTWSMTF